MIDKPGCIVRLELNFTAVNMQSWTSSAHFTNY